MRKKINKLVKSIRSHHSVTALSMIVAVTGISLALAFFAAEFARFKNLDEARNRRHSAYEDELRRLSGLTTNLAPAPDPTANWKEYKNQRYSLYLKYPENWQNVEESLAPKGANYLLRISFNEKPVSGNISATGFDVYIYNAAHFPGPIGTDNLKKKNAGVALEDCPRLDDITLGEKAFQAKEVNITADNPCWEETFFYSLTKNGYTFNIVPRFENGYDIKNFNEKIPLVKVFSKFYDIISTLDLTNEASSTNISQAPRRIVQQVTRLPQVRYSSGQHCAEKNDHPKYSKTKGKHMDEDCCPDPDEWPNPKCAYSGGQLGVMRAKPKK
jgi:hypothetical protein